MQFKEPPGKTLSLICKTPFSKTKSSGLSPELFVFVRHINYKAAFAVSTTS